MVFLDLAGSGFFASLASGVVCELRYADTFGLITILKIDNDCIVINSSICGSKVISIDFTCDGFCRIYLER